MLIDKAGIEKLIPHSGAMVLIDGVLDWDEEDIRCIATSHHNVDNPLRICGGVPSLCGIEYAAQVMAIHGRLASRKEHGMPNQGYLASVRDLEYSLEWLDASPPVLEIWAHCLFHDGPRSIYQFALSGEGAPLLSGRAAVVYLPVVTGL